jgi:glycosyltransferase involved in cell wall biosynthesis
MLISILMPVKNTAPYLSDCLDSILDQTETDWELIAIDDHSTDESGEILRKYAERDERIKTFPNEGKGIIPALQLALSESDGDLVTRMDSDDLMDPEKLAAMKADLVEAEKGHVALGLVEYFSDEPLGTGFQRYEKWLNGLTLKGENFTELYRECVIPSPCWMVYREDLDACGGFEPNRYPEDYDLCFRFYEAGLKPLPSNQVLHLWRDHPKRASRTDDHYSDNTFLDIKLHYFFELNHDPERPLVIWGAGDKGKTIAAYLAEKNQAFHWVCNNPKKIGQTIHGQVLESAEVVGELKNPQVIVVISNPDDQKEVLSELSGESMKDYFFFC